MARIKIPYASAEIRNRNDRRARPDGCNECLFCAAPITGKKKKPSWVHMLTTGELASRDEPVTEGEDQGCFTVGPECAKKVPAEFLCDIEWDVKTAIRHEVP
jgi:hypothetical protein